MRIRVRPNDQLKPLIDVNVVNVSSRKGGKSKQPVCKIVKLYFCKTCKAHFSQKKMLDEHCATEHKKIVPSTRQKSVIDGDKIYYNGYHKIVSTGKFVCDFCTFTSNVAASVSVHSRQNHKGSKSIEFLKNSQPINDQKNLTNKKGPSKKNEAVGNETFLEPLDTSKIIKDEKKSKKRKVPANKNETGEEDAVDVSKPLNESELAKNENKSKKRKVPAKEDEVKKINLEDPQFHKENVEIIRGILSNPSENLIFICPCGSYQSTKRVNFRDHLKRMHRSVWMNELKVVKTPKAEKLTESEDIPILEMIKPEASAPTEVVLQPVVVKTHDRSETDDGGWWDHYEELPPQEDIPKTETQPITDVKALIPVEKVQVPVKNFKCEECPYAGASKSHLNMHVNRMHKGMKGRSKRIIADKTNPKAWAHTGLACHHCSFVGCNMNSLEKHATRNHEGLSVIIHEIPVVSYDCDFCPVTGTDRKEMSRHVACHFPTPNEQGGYDCILCDFTADNPHGLVRHQSVMHLKRKPVPTEPFECDKCDRKDHNLNAMNWHRKQHELPPDQPLSEFFCHECTFTTWHKTMLIYHMYRKHKTLIEGVHLPGESVKKQPSGKVIDAKGRLVLSCDECSYVTVKKAGLKLHKIRKHTEGPQYPCELCNKKYRIESDLTNHMRHVHGNSKPVMCDLCGKQCRDRLLLNLHQRYYHFKPQFKCHLCRTSLMTQANLDEHIQKQHENKQGVVCEECGRTFSKMSRLTTHMRVHTGAKPFECNICSKTFMWSSGLRQHLLIHSGEKPYRCDMCGAAFTQKCGLLCHRRTRHPGPLPPLPRIYIEEIIKQVRPSPEDTIATQKNQ
ncbi:hypothetical protein QAD02_010896 [Eretmocerus hayati]|uniref:Uncharacterized protein n=1 Tax=Eretmocerus hayati TaxID=131215 RepID=A0ACC2NV77_9HYME|nr:hypothetical protein QAD02_010896 [Eretmocerus hayati]